MTREEAVKFAEHAVNMTDIPEVKEFYRMAAGALTPPTQEQVEKVWRGEWEDMREAYNDVPKRRCSRCKRVFIGPEFVDLLVDDYLKIYYIRSAIRQPIGDYAWTTVWSWHKANASKYDEIKNIVLEALKDG